MIHIKEILKITTVLFFVGMLGLTLNRSNVIIMIMSIEIMLLAVNLNFLSFSIYLDDIVGQVFVIFILTIAATESSIGLSILCIFNLSRGSIEPGRIIELYIRKTSKKKKIFKKGTEKKFVIKKSMFRK